MVRVCIATVVVGLFLFLVGFIVYGLLLGQFFAENYGQVMRSKEETKLWTYIVGCLLQALFLALIYHNAYKGGSPFAEGFKYGLYLALFVSLPYSLMVWGGMKVTCKGVCVDAIIGIVSLTIAGIITGLIYGKPSTQASA
jgi:hypothetical protein